MIHPVTTIPLSSKHRVSQLMFHPSRQYLAVQSHDRSVEIFRIRTEEEVRKKQQRRKKRSKEKKEKDTGKSKSNTADPEAMDVEGDQPVEVVDLFTPYLIVRASGKIRSFDFGKEDAVLATKGNTQVSEHLVLDEMSYNRPTAFPRPRF